MPDPVIGDVLGTYQIEGFLGAGSMGDVYLGIDSALGRKVAIKLLANKHRDSAELRARFTREGRAVARVSHANVVQVFTTGVFDERPYIAMEFLDGTDLGSLIEKDGALNSLDAANAVLDAAAGLAAAAEAGLIHRDVKPSNLVRLTTGVVKVTDFGLAKPVDPGTEPALTALGVVVGTPDYIAPEQARGEKIDDRVDIYALGGTLYFLLTAIPPFRTGIPAEDKYLKVVARHLRQPPPNARDKVSDADDELAQLARNMMSKRPDERPTYPELIDQLGEIIMRLRGRNDVSGRVSSVRARAASIAPIAPPISNHSAPPERSAFDTGATIGDTSADFSPPKARVFTKPLALLTVLSVLVLTAGAIAYLLRRGDAKPVSSSGSGSGSGQVLQGATPPLGSGVVTNKLTPPVPPPPADTVLTPPVGMMVIRDRQGKPWFYADLQPITGEQFSAMFGTHKLQKGEGAKPVVGATFVGARGYAKTQATRLMSAAEYDVAMQTAGITKTPTGLVEWIDNGDGKSNTVRDLAGNNATRSDEACLDVTFRRARDL